MVAHHAIRDDGNPREFRSPPYKPDDDVALRLVKHELPVSYPRHHVVAHSSRLNSQFPRHFLLWGQTPWQRHVSHNAPHPLQQPQMPNMKQIKRSVCNHIRHFSLLSHLPSASNPSTQPPIRRLALPLIRSIIQPNAHASSYQPTPQSPSFHQPCHTLQTHSSPPPEPTGNSFTLYRPSTNSCNINSHHVNT